MLPSAAPNMKRQALHAFLVGSICTLARPDTVFDISTDPERRQWWPGATTLDLVPAGRAQTKKVRPTLPVLPLLGDWLQATFDEAEPDPDDAEAPPATGHWLVNYHGRAIGDVGRSWTAMLMALGLPQTREWQPYLLRHSLATILRGAGVPKWELAGFMGHRSSDTTETYAVEHHFSNVMSALQALLADLETRAPGALHRSVTGVASNVLQLRRRQVPSG